MHHPFLLAVASCLAAASPSFAAPSNHKIDSRGDEVDWSLEIVDSTIERHTPETLEGWQYFAGLYLLGQYEVYKRTGEQSYLDYIQEWADRWIGEEGNLNIEVHSLDDMQAANIFLVMYKETEDVKYQQAASQVRDVIDTYPRTSDGGFWHGEELPYQLWSDGVFMVNPFLIRYGTLFGDEEYSFNETVNQIKIYGSHLQVDNGLLQHAYDESRAEDWADPETGRSEEQWCRAMGWYGLTMVDILDLLPEDHSGRQDILDILEFFVSGVKEYQDKESGRWYQVVNKGEIEENWTETSCSAMFVYTISRSLQKGYLEGDDLAEVVKSGSAGVLEKVVKNEDGLTDVHDICIGTGVGNLTFYFERERPINDLHGLGAVLLMNEQVSGDADGWA